MDSPYWKGPFPGVDVQRRYLWKTFRGKPNSIPGSARKCSASARNPVRLAPEYALDELDRELERRGHRYVRYADDCNIYVRSLRAGQRVMESVTQFIMQRLKLKVNSEKSAVARPQERKFLGFSPASAVSRQKNLFSRFNRRS